MLNLAVFPLIKARVVPPWLLKMCRTEKGDFPLENYSKYIYVKIM
jgi:hypothetical protein